MAALLVFSGTALCFSLSKLDEPATQPRCLFTSCLLQSSNHSAKAGRQPVSCARIATAVVFRIARQHLSISRRVPRRLTAHHLSSQQYHTPIIHLLRHGTVYSYGGPFLLFCLNSKCQDYKYSSAIKSSIFSNTIQHHMCRQLSKCAGTKTEGMDDETHCRRFGQTPSNSTFASSETSETFLAKLKADFHRHKRQVTQRTPSPSRPNEFGFRCGRMQQAFAHQRSSGEHAILTSNSSSSSSTSVTGTFSLSLTSAIIWLSDTAPTVLFWLPRPERVGLAFRYFPPLNGLSLLLFTPVLQCSP